MSAFGSKEVPPAQAGTDGHCSRCRTPMMISQSTMSAEGALCSTCAGSIIDDDLNEYKEPGTFGGGFAAGFLGGCIGLGLVLMIAKGDATKVGAGVGFGAQMLIFVVRVAIGS